jgi:3-hydroxyisobutyrate dehydrogenase
VPGPVPTSPANNGYKPGFAAELMLKDLKLAQDAAKATGASTPLGAEAADLYARFAADGNAGTDFSGIIAMLRSGPA